MHFPELFLRGSYRAKKTWYKYSVTTSHFSVRRSDAHLSLLSPPRKGGHEGQQGRDLQRETGSMPRQKPHVHISAMEANKCKYNGLGRCLSLLFVLMLLLFKPLQKSVLDTVWRLWYDPVQIWPVLNCKEHWKPPGCLRQWEAKDSLVCIQWKWLLRPNRGRGNVNL